MLSQTAPTTRGNSPDMTSGFGRPASSATGAARYPTIPSA